jgi:hypothetical protein
VTRRASRLDVLVVVVLVTVVVLALTSQLRRPHAARIVADPVRTPGVVNPDVTQANIRATICRRGWTRTIRPTVSYTDELKRRQMREYGETGSVAGYQEDHLISLELGGHPTDPRNLWPEPYPRAREVDGIENQLNAEVCDGSLALADAQQQEADLKHRDG